MAGRRDSFLDRLRHHRSLLSWARTAKDAATADIATLRAQRDRGRQLRREIDRLLFEAQARLTRPFIGEDVIQSPLGADWAWRPELWRGPISPSGFASAGNRMQLDERTTLFHDCRDSEITLRQVRNRRSDDLAPFGLLLDALGFDGTFLSLAIDLPELEEGLKRRHILRFSTVIEIERPVKIFGRLNIKHGPNTEQILRELSSEGSERMAEFDLGDSPLQENRVEGAWLDLIFEAPRMNAMLLRDVTLSRRLRAEL